MSFAAQLNVSLSNESHTGANNTDIGNLLSPFQNKDQQIVNQRRILNHYGLHDNGINEYEQPLHRSPVFLVICGLALSSCLITIFFFIIMRRQKEAERRHDDETILMKKQNE
uniref:Uncharacterized protein n=1 Tax=Romanomermis culicivorax TaxID=13658 RepID=A0A915I8X3_ROMCU